MLTKSQDLQIAKMGEQKSDKRGNLIQRLQYISSATPAMVPTSVKNSAIKKSSQNTSVNTSFIGAPGCGGTHTSIRKRSCENSALSQAKLRVTNAASR